MTGQRNVSEELQRRADREGALTGVAATWMALSGVLAALAFLTDSVPLLLGAMIVAPAFPPLVRLVVGVAAGRPALALRGLGSSLVGLALATAAAMVTTWAVVQLGLIDHKSTVLTQSLLEERVRTGWYSLGAALAAGIAGTMGYVKDRTDTLIGTVASVALVPAAGAAGAALYAGDPLRAFGGALVLVVNVATIVATGLITVAIVRPARDASQDPEAG